MPQNIYFNAAPPRICSEKNSTNGRACANYFRFGIRDVTPYATRQRDVIGCDNLISLILC